MLPGKEKEILFLLILKRKVHRPDRFYHEKLPQSGFLAVLDLLLEEIAFEGQRDFTTLREAQFIGAHWQ